MMTSHSKSLNSRFNLKPSQFRLVATLLYLIRLGNLTNNFQDINSMNITTSDVCS